MKPGTEVRSVYNSSGFARKALRSLRHHYRNIPQHYRNSSLRNAILAMRAPRPSDRFPATTRRFVLFLIPGNDYVNGGYMSICSIAEETRRLLEPAGVRIAVCTAAGQPRMLRLTKFENNVELFAFSDMLEWIPHGSEVLLHVPEFAVGIFVTQNIKVYQSRPDIRWRFNILLQNIRWISHVTPAVPAMQQLGFTTATLAHKASSAAAADLGCPIHYLSWFISAENFRRVDFSDKKKLITISPDGHPAKNEIIRQMRNALPDHKIVEIRNMTYQRYKEIIRDAKFMFTFGEGLDGYFVESIFSGAVAMAIFSDHFFTSEYHHLPGVFDDEGAAKKNVGNFLTSAQNEDRFRAIAQQQYDTASQTFRHDVYHSNIRSFYTQYCPDWQA